MSVVLSQLHYETDGFIENDAAEKDIYDLFFQKQFGWNSSIQLDVKRSDFESGETFFRFDPPNAFPVTVSEDGKFYRLSGHHGTGANADLIWTVVHEDSDRVVDVFPDLGLLTFNDGKATAAELQQTNAWERLRIIYGAGYVADERDFRGEPVLIKSEAANAYMYGLWRSPDDTLRIQAGLSADWYEREHSDTSESVDRQRLSPKLGLIWLPLPGSTVRIVSFSSVRRPFIGSQTIEPTQVAGFNQFFSGF